MAEFRTTPTTGKRELNSYCIPGINQVVKVGDCVLTRPSPTGKAPRIARIEGIEADDGGSVKVRVRLYYRPQEALGGRRKFHGSKELFFSNHYDVRSALSIEGRCTVHSLKSYTKLQNIGAEDYYCRFEYNAATGAFTPDQVAVYCKCEMPYNPDDLMVKCEGCKDRFHPACIDITFEEAKKLDHYVCSECASKHDDKRQKQNNGFPSPPGEADAKRSEPPSYKDLEEIAKKERERIENLLNSKGVKYGSYPRFTMAVKGQKLISNLVSNLGLKVDERIGGSDMHLRAWNSAVSWQLTLQRPEKSKISIQDKGHSVETDAPGGDLCVLLFRSLISTDKVEIEFMKSGSFSTIEIDALIASLQLAGGRSVTLERQPNEGGSRGSSIDKSVSALESMGVKIYGLTKPLVNSSKTEISWDDIAGCDQQKREIENTILLALHSPEVYDDIARGTRRKFDSNRPRAVLFEGPPGTGKTSCARVIASQTCVPLLYVPLEIVVSKYNQEIERLLGEVFSLANELPNGAIIFLDEVDAIAIARDTVMHEATRRTLSILLQQIHGFEQMKKVVVVAATNRKQDLDRALISRFDATISFGLPDQPNRQKITAQYAKHLSEFELEQLAKVTKGLSGRDIRDVCQQAERSWASKIIRGQMDQPEQIRLPPFAEYIHSALNRA